MGRTREVSRFKLHSGSSARQSALGDGIGTQVDTLMRSELGDGELLDDAFVGVNSSVWDADASFPETPTSVTDDPRWTIAGCGKWRFEDNIVRLEAHALIKGIERLAITTFGTCIRQLFLVDNMSVCLCFAQARCRDYRLLKLVRRFQSFCLSRCIIAHVRWIPCNSADRPSRIFDNSDVRQDTGVGYVGSSSIAVPRRVGSAATGDVRGVFLILM